MKQIHMQEPKNKESMYHTSLHQLTTRPKAMKLARNLQMHKGKKEIETTVVACLVFPFDLLERKKKSKTKS